MPLDAYDVYRATAPVAWVNETPANGHAGAGFWAITRWDDVVAIHKDWRRFSSEVGGTEIEELEPDAIVARRTMLETDPPRHTRLRQLVNPTFSRATVQTYAEHARALVDDVLSEALIASHGAEPVDAVAMIAASCRFECSPGCSVSRTRTRRRCSTGRIRSCTTPIRSTPRL